MSSISPSSQKGSWSHTSHLYFADAHGSWRWTDSRRKRPASIVLNPGVKGDVVRRRQRFLEEWEEVTSFRVPGSGKSSLIHALAGQLQLDIYVVSISASWISDNTLTALMGLDLFSSFGLLSLWSRVIRKAMKLGWGWLWIKRCSRIRSWNWSSRRNVVKS